MVKRALLALCGILLLTGAVHAEVKPCCTITALDARAAMATARENASGRTLVFKVTDARLFASLRVGAGVYANFTTRQVSLDGKTACCSIVSMENATPNPGVVPQSGQTAQQPSTSGDADKTKKKPGQDKKTDGGKNSPGTEGTVVQPAPEPTTEHAIRAATAANPRGQGQTTTGAKKGAPGTGVAGMQVAKVNPIVIPPITYGTPQPVPSGSAASASLAGRRGSVNANAVRLRGIDGIKSATGIPQAAKDFLLMHAKTLPPGEVDNYVVNARLAEEWFRTHPEPESVKKAAAKGDSHTGCNAISVHCAEEAGQHAADEAARQSQKLLQEAQGEWNHVMHEVEHDWKMAEGCFADSKLILPNIPVKFSVTPQFPLSFERDGKTGNQYGSASGTIKGTVTFGVPIQSDFTAQVDMFYIPCLPFAVRPRSIAASGKMGVGSLFGASVTATGKFNQTFTIPPTGGPHFPIEVIPIVIAGVPVAELDVSVYVDGRILVDGEGKIAGAVGVNTMQDTAFDFSCSGKACELNQRSVPEPVTTTESVKIDGRIHVKPEVYAALQLDFDVDLLTARAGPQPYLLGEIYGCTAASASQTGGAPTSSQESYALTGDLDWGVELRAEALVAEKKVAEKDWKLLQRHLYFKDLANSTALIPTLNGSAQPPLGQPAVYTMRMPTCYPYPDPVQYQVAWTGGATPNAAVPANSTPAGKPAGLSATRLVGNTGSQPANGAAPSSCALQPGQSHCWGDPLKNASFSLAWPAMGNFSVMVTPVRDKHGRKFDPSRASQLNVSVQ